MIKDLDELADLIENNFLDTPMAFLANTKLISERMNPENIVSPIAKLTGLDRAEVSERLADLPLDDTLDLIDAINNQDEATVLLMLNIGRNVHEDDEEEDDEFSLLDPEDDDADQDDGFDAETDDEFRDEESEEDDAPIGEALAIGQEVKVGNKDGVIKISDAPGDTAGVLVDGEMKMVEKNKVARVDENVLGMTQLPGLRRMLELAGVPGTVVQVAPEGDATAEVQDAADAVVTGPTEIPAADDAAEATADATAEVAAAGIEADAAAEQAEADGEEGAGECLPGDDDCEGAERPHEVETSDPEADIVAALEVIEKNIRNVKVGGFKAINDRIQAIQGSLFESMVVARKRL